MNMNQWIAVALVIAAVVSAPIFIFASAVFLLIALFLFFKELTTDDMLKLRNHISLLVPEIKKLRTLFGSGTIKSDLQTEGLSKITAEQEGAEAQPASGHADARGEGGPEDTQRDAGVVQRLRDAAEQGMPRRRPNWA